MNNANQMTQGEYDSMLHTPVAVAEAEAPTTEPVVPATEPTPPADEPPFQPEPLKEDEPTNTDSAEDENEDEE